MLTPLKYFATAAALSALTACTTVHTTSEFDPKTCMGHVPQKVPGLQIIHGPRTEQNIASDMHPAWCNGQVLLKRMNDEGKAVSAGTVTFKTVVEYTGEVASVTVVESDIGSAEFVQKVSDMIMDSDFTPWQRHDDDAEFIYPMVFTRWWDDRSVSSHI